MLLKFFLKATLFGLLATNLASCQGSNLGNSLESAIAPASPTTSDAIATPEVITPKSTTKIITKPFVISDRLSAEMKAISLKSFANLQITSQLQKTSLKALFSIDFGKNLANAQPQANNFSDGFSDLETAPAPLRPWIKDLNKLGTIAPKTGNQFQPNILVARREYARWLLQTNNRLYKNQPSRQIRLAQPTDSASFPDIANNHPDFTIIQGLANAGLIGGTGDRFRPNDPLLREELVQWKIPLDLRQPLPNATTETVNQAWGFKDGDRISENALSAIFADSQLRDISSIRRSFGFTTLLQPQKPVTRAEAAASLWYFGTATDGISASKVLESDQ